MIEKKQESVTVDLRHYSPRNGRLPASFEIMLKRLADKDFDESMRNRKQKQEPIYIVGKGWQVDEIPPDGMKLYTQPTTEVMQRMAKALKELMSGFERKLDGCENAVWYEEYRAAQDALDAWDTRL